MRLGGAGTLSTQLGAHFVPHGPSMLSGSWDPLPALSGHVRCKATAPASSRARAKELTRKSLCPQAELSLEPPVLTEAEFDELFGSTSDLNELLVTQLHGAGGGRATGSAAGRRAQVGDWWPHTSVPSLLLAPRHWKGARAKAVLIS